MGIPSTFDFSYAPPVDLCWISILLVASHNAAFTADALCHVKVEAVLLSGFGLSLRNSRSWRERQNVIEAFFSHGRYHARRLLAGSEDEDGAVISCSLYER
jgi:hypothetical protein